MRKASQAIKQEVTSLHSATVGLSLQDREGDYKESFIIEIQKASLRTPTKTFKDRESFLEDLNRV
jgi:hypothetical protein